MYRVSKKSVASIATRKIETRDDGVFFCERKGKGGCKQKGNKRIPSIRWQRLFPRESIDTFFLFFELAALFAPFGFFLSFFQLGEK